MSEPVGAGGLLDGRLRVALLVVALLSFLATVASLLFGRTLAVPGSEGADSYSRAAAGHHALAATLEELGLFVLRHRHADYAGATAPMLFLEPPSSEVLVGGRPVTLAAALAARAERGLDSVVVLPKWRPQPDGTVTPIGRAEVIAVLDGVMAVPPASALTGFGVPVRHHLPIKEEQQIPFAGPRGRFVVAAPWMQYFHAVPIAELDVVVGTAEAALVVARALPNGARIVVVADPDVAHNFALGRGDHAALWATLLREDLATDTVSIDETLHGHGHVPSLGAALGSYPVVLVALHAVVLALLVVAAGLRRFGPALPLPPPLGRGPTEVIGVTAAVFAAGRPAAHLTAAYVARLLADTAQAVGLSAAGTTAAARAERDRLLDEAAARRHLPRQARMLTERAERFEVASTSGPEAVRLAQRAWDFQAALLARGVAAPNPPALPARPPEFVPVAAPPPPPLAPREP